MFYFIFFLIYLIGAYFKLWNDLVIFNIFFFIEDFFFFFVGLDLNSTITFSVVISIIKLFFIWFFVVWLRMNLMRLRFDQVASYTWHELVIVSISILILIGILLYCL